MSVLRRSRTALLGLAATLALATPASAADPATIKALLERASIPFANANVSTERMRAGYAARGYRAIWMNGTELTPAGAELVTEAAAAYRDGLEPSEYLNAISGFSEATTPEEAARTELALTSMYLTLGHDLYSGLTTPSVASKTIVIRRKKADWSSWIAGAAKSGPKAMLKTLRPNHPQYAQLRQMLDGYRTQMMRGGWPAIAEGGTLKAGMSSARVAQMRRNLRARAYDIAAKSANPNLFDAELVEAVKHFQERHGLAADGVAGPNTIRAMNVPASRRVEQLAINLERWRWLPRDLGARHVLVNQAGYELFLKDGNRTVDRRRVIVGKPYHQTPIFSDEMIYAEFNPTWTIPASILGKEMLPKIRANPSYLTDKGYSLYTSWKQGARPTNPHNVDWTGVSAKRFPYRVVQGPGPKNALGQVKFIFPNKHAVYMHDTPSRNLFSKAGRAFSHGCIRVHKPLDFARHIFALNGGLDPARVDGIVASKKTTRVNLDRKLPVHLAYFTAWVDDDGVPSFFNDVYERDRLVGKYLF